jgi:hypothetical protein
MRKRLRKHRREWQRQWCQVIVQEQQVMDTLRHHTTYNVLTISGYGSAIVSFGDYGRNVPYECFQPN